MIPLELANSNHVLCATYKVKESDKKFKIRQRWIGSLKPISKLETEKNAKKWK